jgi:hypothetical protein
MRSYLVQAGAAERPILSYPVTTVITGQTGLDRVFGGAADFDLELIEHRTLDGHIQELIYRPVLHA